MNKTGLFRTWGNYAQLLTAEGLRQRAQMVAFSLCCGIIHSGALLCLVMAASSMSTGQPVLGLATTGWIIVLGVLAMIGFVATYQMSMASYRGAMDIMRNFHRVIGNQLVRLPLGWFTPRRAASLSRTASDGMIGLGTAFAHLLSQGIIEASAMAVLLVGVTIWKPTLGLALIVATPVFFGVLALTARAAAAIRRRSEPAKVELSDRLVEYARCQPALRAAGRSGDYDLLSTAVDVEERQSRRKLWQDTLLLMCNGMLAQFLIVILIVLGAQLATGGNLNPLETIAFIGVALRCVQSMIAISEVTVGLQEQEPLLGTIDEVLHEPLLPEPESSSPFSEPGKVQVHDVTFGYDSDQPVLRGVSFTTEPRTMTALVGPSGSGKTTLTKLIARFYDADSGTVQVSGCEVGQLTTADLMGQLSMVFQDVYLFDDSLEANIRVGRVDATDEEVRAAADRAGVTEIAERLPDGWQTRVGEGGTLLSGGERQRVAIARALLKRAPIVLIDEATAALDAENEANIVAAFEELREYATLIVIAHKLDTIQAADQIVVLDDDGSVAQIGSHSELVTTPGRYQDFCHARAAAQGWQLTREES